MTEKPTSRRRQPKAPAGAAEPSNPDTARRGHPRSLVVVGASAGGIQALSALLEHVREDLPAPIVVAQHLEPTRPSMLGSILQRHTRMKVQEIEGSTAMTEGVVYVVPSGRHVVIKDGQVALADTAGFRSRPSVDLLLATAAAAYGDRLYAVILTGSGTDGVGGAMEVKHAGGTVLIQNPATARHPSMPCSLPPTVVDHQFELEAFGDLIWTLLHRAQETAEATDEAARDRIFALVGGGAGIDFSRYKPATLLRRIAKRMAMTAQPTMAAYADHLESAPAELDELVRALLINVTAFFRDADAFGAIRDRILPLVTEQARGKGRVMRIWSAGCSTGEEAYSVAFMLADLLGPELHEWNIKIFATDLGEEAIRFARRGVYAAGALQALPEGYLQRFFEPSAPGYRITKSIRQLVIFGQQDLSRGIPFPRIDLALCRNLLIYFKPELQRTVLDLLAYSLRPGQGYLFLGKAETVRPSQATFELIDKRWKIYRCRGSAPLQVPALGFQSMPMSHALPRPETSVSRTQAAMQGDSRLSPLTSLIDQVFAQLPRGAVVLDRNYRVVALNPAARRMLALRDGGNGQDFLHASRGLPYRETRKLIDTVLRSQKPASLDELQLDSNMAGEPGTVLSMTAVALAPDSGGAVLLDIQDVSEAFRTRRHLAEVREQHEGLLQELARSNERLTELNRQLQETNDELQSANEELAVAQEELQAVNEEFEATNEELQATNEEMETSNEELQATNEELEATNDELNARASELQEVMVSLSDEKQLLAEVVALAPFSIMVLAGAELNIEQVNEHFLRELGRRPLLKSALGEHIEHPLVPQLMELLNRCMREDRTLQGGPWSGAEGDTPPLLIYTAVPSHGAQGKVRGALLYSEDVTQQHDRAAREKSNYLSMMVESAEQVAMGLFDGHSGLLLQANRRYLDLLTRLGMGDGDTLLGGSWNQLGFDVPELTREQSLALLVTGGQLPAHPLIHLGDAQGESIWEWLTYPLPRNGGGERAAYVVVCAMEITEQEQARRKIEEMNQQQSDFISLAGHELRTPLVPLTAYIDTLDLLMRSNGRPRDPDDRLQITFGNIRRQLGQVVRLTDDLLDVARIQSGKFTLRQAEVDLRRLVNDSISALRQAHPGLEVQVDHDDVVSLICRGDAQRLHQVFGNLFDNAVKFGGRQPIGVSVSRQPATQRWPAGNARIVVCDQGPGIPEAEVEQIFDKSFQSVATREGFGMGLFICRSIVEAHEGTITAVPGSGARLVILLPLMFGAGTETGD